MIEYKDFEISDTCKRFILLICTMKQIENKTEKRFFIPACGVNICFVEDNKVTAKINNKVQNFNPGVYFISQITNVVPIKLYPKSKLTFIGIPAWTLSYLKNIHYTDLLDTVIKLDEQKYDFLKNRSKEYDCYKIRRATEMFFYLVNQQNQYNNLIENICQYIYTNYTHIKLVDIVNFTHYSKRSIQTKFKQNTGLTLKQYILQLKLRETLKNIILKEQKNISSTSLSYGYYDQSHFIKVFKEIIKLNPKNFKQENYVLPELF